MNKLRITYSGLTFFIVTLLLSCSERTSIVKLKWAWIDSYDRNFLDSCFLEKKIYENTSQFRYFTEFPDSLEFWNFELLDNMNLVFNKIDTVRLTQIVKLKYKNDSVKIMKYEYPDYPPGGAGCWLMHPEYGMIGNGLYVGGKMILNKYDEYIFDTIEISELIKEKSVFPPPPPSKEIMDMINADYKEN